MKVALLRETIKLGPRRASTGERCPSTGTSEEFSRMPIDRPIVRRANRPMVVIGNGHVRLLSTACPPSIRHRYPDRELQCGRAILFPDRLERCRSASTLGIAAKTRAFKRVCSRAPSRDHSLQLL